MTKKTSKSLLDRFFLFLNVIAVVLLLFAYLLPNISPIKASGLAVLSLFVPIMFVINILFAIFWIVRLKKYFILSFFTIAIGLGFLSSIYKFSKKEVTSNNDFSLMSYNVRMFNHYGWNPDNTLSKKAYDFISKEKPDILAIQEYHDGDQIQIYYPYKYIKTKRQKHKFGLAIFSKYPIITSGSLNLENTSNNIIFADIAKGLDTIRIYNIHLESLGISKNEENFGQENSNKLFQRLKLGFKEQAKQTKKFLQHQKEWKGKTIVCGDFNNTSFSWIYKQISEGKQDAFREAGKGTGSTFDYIFPLRIDFILPDLNFSVNQFQTYPVKYSDHFPILARLERKN